MTATSGRNSAFTSGTGAEDPTIKSVAIDLAKAAPGAIWNAAKREADYLDDGDYKVRATGHVVNFLSDIAQGVSNVGINAVNAVGAEAAERSGTKGFVFPNVRTPKLNVDSTTRNVSITGGSLDRNPEVGTASSLGFVVEGNPMESVSRIVEGAGLVPVLKPIKAVKAAGKAVTNEVENAVRASAGSVKPKVSPKDVTPNTLAPKNQGEILPPKGTKPTFEPRTPGGPTTPKIIRTEEPKNKFIDPETGDVAPPSKNNTPRTLEKPDGPTKGQENKNKGTTLTKDNPDTSANTREGRGLRPEDVESKRGVQGGTPSTKPQGPRIKPKPVIKPAVEPKPPAPAPAPAPAPKPEPLAPALKPEPPASSVAPTSTLVRSSTDETARESRRLFPSTAVSPQSLQFTSPKSSVDESTKTESSTEVTEKIKNPRNHDLGTNDNAKQDVRLRRIN
jgi:hypothetical protein